MKYVAEFSISENSSELYDVVAVEEKDMQTDRAKVTITKDKGSCNFKIEAKDWTAFPALLFSGSGRLPLR